MLDNYFDLLLKIILITLLLTLHLRADERYRKYETKPRHYQTLVKHLFKFDVK